MSQSEVKGPKKSKKKLSQLIKYKEFLIGLHQFTHKDLFHATKGFNSKHSIGVGRFGREYKGVLPTSKSEVAVKTVSYNSKQGMIIQMLESEYGLILQKITADLREKRDKHKKAVFLSSRLGDEVLMGPWPPGCPQHLGRTSEKRRREEGKKNRRPSSSSQYIPSSSSIGG